MMQVNEIAFVGYPITDVPRARKFYEGVLGLKVETDMSSGDHTWIEYGIAGGTLALSNSWPPSGQSGPGVALEVDDFDDAIASMRESGIEMTMGPEEFPSCHMAIIMDPDKNAIVLHKRKA